MKEFTAWFWGSKQGYIGPYSYTEIIMAPTKKIAYQRAKEYAVTNNWRFLQFI